jgi:hypothetical protein
LYVILLFHDTWRYLAYGVLYCAISFHISSVNVRHGKGGRDTFIHALLAHERVKVYVDDFSFLIFTSHEDICIGGGVTSVSVI